MYLPILNVAEEANDENVFDLLLHDDFSHAFMV